MPIEYVPGAASLDPLYQKLISVKKEHFEDLEESYFTFRRSLGGIDIPQQNVSATLDGYVAQANTHIRNIDDAFVDLINVTDTPSHVLDRLIQSTYYLYASLLQIFGFTDRLREADDLNWDIEIRIREQLTLLKRILRENHPPHNANRNSKRARHNANRNANRSANRNANRSAKRKRTS